MLDKKRDFAIFRQRSNVAVCSELADINTFKFLQKLLSGRMILLTITLKLRIILQNI